MNDFEKFFTAVGALTIAQFAYTGITKEPVTFTLESIHMQGDPKQSCTISFLDACTIQTDKGEFTAGGILAYSLRGSDSLKIGETYDGYSANTVSRTIAFTLKRQP